MKKNDIQKLGTEQRNRRAKDLDKKSAREIAAIINREDAAVPRAVKKAVPQIAKREVNTAVLVEDGQTVVIGGVYEFSDTSEISKVPFLGDIPVLGNLFRNKNRSKSKAELLVFVTPKVMRVAQR